MSVSRVNYESAFFLIMFAVFITVQPIG